MIPDDKNQASMRISDKDRDRAASILAEAVADGRLTADEHSQRLDAVYAAKTSADVAPLISDLPGSAGYSPDVLPLASPAGQVPAVSRPTRMIYVFSGGEKKGIWQVPEQIHAVNIFGGTSLDLREAALPSKEIRIRALCIFGGMEIKIPPGMQVIDSGFSIFGGRDVPAVTENPALANTPVLYLHAIVIFGGISVSRRSRKDSQRNRSEE